MILVSTLKNTRWPVRLLWFSSLYLFMGRGIQAMWGNSGIVDFLAFESIISPAVKLFIPWQTYVSEIYPGLAEWVSWGILSIYFLSLFVLFMPLNKSFILLIGGGVLLADVILALPGDFYWLAGLAGKTLMWSPVFLYLIYREPSEKWWNVGRWAVSAVFISHGLSALNILPVPGGYSDLITILTGWSEGITRSLLLVVGILDIIAALSILFFPLKVKLVWWYLILWGLVTAFARLAGNFSLEVDFSSNSIWLAEMLIRLPHGLVPLALYILVLQKVNHKIKRAKPLY
jgi:hypothetical protein